MHYNAGPATAELCPRGNLVRQHLEKFGNLPEDLQLTKACDDAGFDRKCLSLEDTQLLVTIPDVHLAGYGPTEKDFCEAKPKLVRY